MNSKNILSFVFVLILLSCQTTQNKSENIQAFIGATIIDGISDSPIADGVILVQDGKIISVGSKLEVELPSGAVVIDVSNKFMMPGIINVHGHVGDIEGLESGKYSKANVLRDLKLNTHYGVTAINSLGGDRKESADIRNEQDSIVLNRSRLFIAGEVVTGSTPEEAIMIVDKNAAMGVDFIKIRVDDNLRSAEKMSPEIYKAVIERAHEHKLPVAAHIFYLEDAKALLRLGVKFIAHSVRDQEVDEEFIQLMLEGEAFYCPTLMREVSTFVYEETPSFFDDPFFLEAADTAVLSQLNNPERQQRVRENKSAQAYKEALAVAMTNLKTLSDRGVRIALGTDSGPPARFQGYFEHKELEMMVAAGLSPLQSIQSCTKEAAACIYQDKLGTISLGKWADFIVLNKNPLDDITNTRNIESVWIGGTKQLQ